MDPFTQKLLERTRQRREQLQQKMAESPRAAPRKRRTPLAEDNSNNIMQEETPATDESPKRHCVREMEREIKPDTPAVPGVRSRMAALATEHKQWLSDNSDEAMDTEPAPPPQQQSSVSSSSTDEDAPVPKSRRSRFAALAANIDSWEDDLKQSRPIVKEQKVERKIWQPPKPTSQPQTKVDKPVAKPDRQFNKLGPVKAPPKEEAVPAKPPRTFEHEEDKNKIVTSTTTKEVEVPTVTTTTDTTHDTFVSKLTVNVSRDSSGQPSQVEIKLPLPGGGEETVTDVTSHFTRTKTTTVEKRNQPAKVTRVTKEQEPPAKVTRTRKDQDEPTAKPVHSRMAAWEQKVSTAGGDPPKPKTTAPVRPPEPKKLPAKYNAPSVNAAPANQRPRQPMLSLCQEGKKKTTEPTYDPVERSVETRMGLWEDRIQQNSKDTQLSPLKHAPQKRHAPPVPQAPPAPPPAPAKSPVKPAPMTRSPVKQPAPASPSKVPVGAASPYKKPTGVTSPVKSPQVSAGMKAVQERLIKQMDKGWQETEIAAKSRQAREAEMQVLQNRWKNGVLKEEDDRKPEMEEPTQPMVQNVESSKDNSSSSGSAPSNQEQVASKENTSMATKEISREKESLSNLTSEAKDAPKTSNKSECTKEALVDNEKTRTAVDVKQICDVKPAKSGEPTAKHDQPIQPKPAAQIFKETTSTEDQSANNDQKRKRSTQDSGGATIKTQKLEELRKDFEGKLAAMGFDVHSSADLNGKRAKVATMSLKERQLVEGDIAPPEPRMKMHVVEDKQVKVTFTDKPTSKVTVKVQEDSFDEDDDEFEATMSQYPAVALKHKPSTASLASTVSTASTPSVASEFLNRSDISETSDGMSERSDSRMTTDTQDDHSVTESEAACNEIDDLLDEAMDNSMESESSVDVRPEPMPRQTRPPSGRSRPMSVPKAPSMESVSSDDGKPLVYSVSFYRSTKYKNNGPAPKMTVVRRGTNSNDSDEEEDELPYMPEQSVKQKIQHLQDLVNQEQSVIMQTSNALNQCCSGNSSFKGSAEQVECNRLLLLACQKRQAYLEEIHHLKSGRPPHQDSHNRGSLTISDIRLPLKRDFLSKIGTKDDTSVHYFLCMIRNGPHIIFTQMVSTHDAMVRNSLDFPNLIKLNEIKDGFRYNLEIYGMSVRRETMSQPKDTPKKKGLFTPKKLLGKNKGSSASNPSPGGPTAVRTTNFSLVASLPITMESLHKNSFTLDKVPFLSPLHGSIQLKLRCIMESSIEERGFLTMFEDVSGFGAWHRRWCVLKENKVKYWKYPDDETRKPAIGYVDLKHCITGNVGLVPRDVCARQNTFQLLVVTDPEKARKDSLTTHYYNTVATNSHLFSADTKEDRVVWCNRLNEVLQNLRTWHSDALRPIKQLRQEDTV